MRHHRPARRPDWPNRVRTTTAPSSSTRKVLKEDPDNRDARLSLDRAKLRAALDHYNRGLRLRNGGRLDEALVELQIASELNPASGDIDKALTRRPLAAAHQGGRRPARARRSSKR